MLLASFFNDDYRPCPLANNATKVLLTLALCWIAANCPVQAATSAQWVPLQATPTTTPPQASTLEAPQPTSLDPDNEALLVARRSTDTSEDRSLKEKLFGWLHHDSEPSGSVDRGWNILQPNETTHTSLPTIGLNTPLSEQQLISFIQKENPRHNSWLTNGIARGILEASQRNNVDPKLLASVVAVESSFRPNVISSSGAMGMGQLLPTTARWLQVADPFDPVDNLIGTGKYLRYLHDMFNGDETKAVASYFVGQGTVKRQGVSPMAKQYVDKVRAKRTSLESL